MAHLYSEDLYGAETFSQATEQAAAGAGTYNEIYYNENCYNAAVLVLALFETLTSTDAKVFDDSVTHAELFTLMDNLQKIFNGAIFNEMLTPSDVLLNQAQIAKLDILALTDVRTASFIKLLLETMTLADVREMVLSRTFGDAVVLLDTLTKFISNKGLNDTIRVQDWLSIKKNPAENIWSN